MSDFVVDTLEGSDGELVHQVHTTMVNWTVLQDDSGATLIDGGYPQLADTVLASLEDIGVGPDQVRAGLVTHGHIDHIGGLRVLSERFGFPVYADPVEVPHVRREYLDQVSVLDIAKLSYRPRVLRWANAARRLGGLDRTPIADAAPFPGSGVLDLPGRPVPIACPGHTDGHCAYLVGGGRMLCTGDALVTGHMTSGVDGPQCLHRMFQHDETTNRASVQALAALDVDVVLPGHGPTHHGPIATAVATALG